MTMDAKTQAHYEARAKIVKAMAHPSRLLIVEELSKRDELCVCEFTEMIGSDISTVSRHLGQLKNAGLVADRRDGANVFYHLRVKCLLNFFKCIEAVMKSNAACQQELMG